MSDKPTTTQWVRVRQAAELVNIRGSRLYELLNEVPAGAIKTVTLRSPGAKRGAILISMPSLLEYLNRLSEKQTKGKQQLLAESDQTATKEENNNGTEE